MLLVPFDRPSQAILKERLRPEAELALGAAYVQTPARLAVGLAGIPDDIALEAGQPGDRLDEVADRDLHAAAKVDRLVALVALGRQHDPRGGVLDIQELARRRAVAPDLDRRRAAVDRLDA